MPRVVVPHEDEWRVPQAPDDADDDSGAEKRLPFKLTKQVAPPAHLLAEGEEGINGDACQHARQEGKGYCSRRTDGH